MAGNESGSGVPEIGRRQVLGVAGVAVGGGLVLTACGGGSDKKPSATGLKGKEIAKTADVPVGGGKVIDDLKIVVAQPKAGEFKAYSAICTHKGCTVDTPKGETVLCPCHGSEFSCVDGKPVKGPATVALPAIKIEVKGDGIVVA